MAECPACGDAFDPGKGIKYLDEVFCSQKCAQEACEEGRTANEPIEVEVE